MKKFSLSIALFIILLSACSQAPAPQPELGLVHLVSGFDSSASAAIISGKEGRTALLSQGNLADSLQVKKVRFLLKEVRVHDEGNVKSQIVFADPLVYNLDAGKVDLMKSSYLDTGSYSGIKFELHKFTPGTADFFRNDPRFQEFLTNGNIFTTIIEGVVFAQGAAHNFSYKSDPVANLSVKFDRNIRLLNDSTFIINLLFSPKKAFRAQDGVLDPRDERNKQDIDNMIRDAFRTKISK